MVGALAWAYVRYGSLPSAAGWLYGLKPALLAVIGQALWVFGKSLMKDRLRWVVALAALLGVLLGVHELALLVLAGLAVLLIREGLPKGGAWTLLALPAAPVPLSPSGLFWTFLKIGSVLYGSGYVLLAFLRAEFVVRHPMLTERQLLDAVAVGQFTPGPVFTTATFAGYLMEGWPGALATTLGIFLPSFLFVALSGRLLDRVKHSPRLRALLDGVNAASLALMALVLGQLGRAALVDPWSLALFALAALTLWRTTWNPTWVLLGSGLAGIFLRT